MPRFDWAAHGVIMDLDPYAVLGVKPSDSLDDITKVYKSLAKKYHPDINKDENAEEKIKEINSAFDKIKKKTQKSISPEDGVEVDIGFTLNIEPDFIFNGCKVSQFFNLAARCDKCHGIGSYGTKRPCPMCSSGWTLVFNGGCPACDGRKWVYDTQCNICNGSRTRPQSIYLEFEIPKNFNIYEDVIDITPKDLPGSNYQCRVLPDLPEEYFLSEYSYNLFRHVKINPVEQIIGSKKTIEGIKNINGQKEKINIEIPKLLENQKSIVIPGYGLPIKDNKRSDLELRVVLEWPKSITPEQEEYLKKYVDSL